MLAVRAGLRYAAQGIFSDVDIGDGSHTLMYNYAVRSLTQSVLLHPRSQPYNGLKISERLVVAGFVRRRKAEQKTYNVNSHFDRPLRTDAARNFVELPRGRCYADYSGQWICSHTAPTTRSRVCMSLVFLLQP